MQTDLLIIGGGINGVGIARDAAGRGLSVTLVEQDDLAQHTSSASTKLIHGGLRYLEYMEFRLVREALIERKKLLSIAPHIIRPQKFVLPHKNSVRPAWLIRLGLFIYDHLGGREKLPVSHTVDLTSSPYGVSLKPDLHKAFVYYDCWVDDSRLVVLNALSAAEKGARILTRTKLVEAHPHNGTWTALLENSKTGARQMITAKAIINAAGPWVDDILADKIHTETKLHTRLVKGSHIVVPRQFEGSHAYMMQNEDRRIVFAIPYEEKFTLIGTTEVPWSLEQGKAQISNEEIDYLCTSVNQYFKKPVSKEDIIWSYSGVRPLYDDDAASASATTRDYVLDLQASQDMPPLLSVFGGKITTYRKLAEHALEKLKPYLPDSTKPWTSQTPLPGGELEKMTLASLQTQIASAYPFLSEHVVTRLTQAYGTRSFDLLENAHCREDMGYHFGGGLYAREIDYLVKQEWARTAEDILYRRSKLGLHLPKSVEGTINDYLGSKKLDGKWKSAP